jgi:hypothetical protein
MAELLVGNPANRCALKPAGHFGKKSRDEAG